MFAMRGIRTYTGVINYHTQLQLFIMHSGINMHSYKHSFIFITFINREYNCKSQIDKIAYLFNEELAPHPAMSLQCSTQP